MVLTIICLLVLLYAVILLRALHAARCRVVATTALCALTGALVWALIYASFSDLLAPWLSPESEEAFASVETIQREVPASMLMWFFATD